MKAKSNVKLKTVLFERGITQRELAFGSKIDEPRLSSIIRGWEQPTPEMQDSIADFLELPVDELFPAMRKAARGNN